MTAKNLLFLACATMVLFLANCSHNIRSKSGMHAELPLSPRIVRGQLDNGLTYFAVHNRLPAGRCYVRFNVAVGSFAEADDELGMAHAVEHLAFDDRSISGEESLMEWLQKNGMAPGADANAETLPEYTTYKIDLPTCDQAGLTNALAIFRGFADGLAFREEAIAKEKNIIDAEERQGNDMQAQLTRKLLKHLYSNTLYVTRPVLGESSVRALFTQEMFKAFYHKWYTPDLMTIALVGDYGDIDPADLIKTAFHSMEQRLAPAQPKNPAPTHDTPFFAIHESELAHVETIFSIQSKSSVKPNFAPALLKEKLAFDLALAMVQEVYVTQFHQDNGLLREPSIDGALIDDGVYELNLNIASLDSDLEEKFLAIYLELAKAAQLGFDENIVNATKGVMRDAFQQAVVTETTLTSDQWANRLLNHINETSPVFDATQYAMAIEPILASITPTDCKLALKKALQSGQHYLYVIGAIQEGPTSTARLANLLEKAKALKPAALASELTPTFYYHTDTCNADIDAPVREDVPVIAARKMRLSNGIDVVLKKTNHQKDELKIAIITNTGDSSMSIDDYARAHLARFALLEGGLRKHDAAEIIKLLKDKFFNLSLAIFPDRIETNIATRNQDLQFALEMAKAFITDPNYAETSLQSIKDRMAIVHREREHQLWSPIERDFLKVLSGNDHRASMLPMATINAIDRNALLSWHQRFITEQPLRIVVVGDFDEDDVAHKLTCIFADLSTQAKHKNTIAKLTFKPGIHKTYRIVAKDEAPLINVRYPLNFTSKPYPDHRLQILQALIAETVRLKLREKRQTTYAQNVTAAENKLSAIQNWLDISFSTEKSKAEATTKELIQLIDKLATKGINQVKLTKAVEPYLTQAQRTLTNNGFWSSLIANNFDDLPALDWTNRIEKDVKAIHVAEINQLLKKYFRATNASSAIVFPAE